jgi:hypothetical protein
MTRAKESLLHDEDMLRTMEDRLVKGAFAGAGPEARAPRSARSRGASAA